MSDSAAKSDTPAGEQLPVPDRSLTVAPERLAGSPQCLNCGTILQGPFCHFCGQPDRNFLRFFPVLLRELLEDFLDFDSRFVRTMKPLLFKPGKLTRDYLDGRRFRYTPPLRLYIFSSIACFFFAALLAGDAIRVSTDGVSSEGPATGVHVGTPEDPKVRAVLDRLDPETRQQAEAALAQAAEEQAAVHQDGGEAEGTTEDDHDDEDTITINGEPWDRETNPFIIEWMPDWVNDWVNDEIEQSPQKGKEIEQNPDLIREKVFDVLPATMIALLPIVALLLKFWYLFAKKYYIEHLIFALHGHSFLFVMLLIILLLGAVGDWLQPSGDGNLSGAIQSATVVIGIWIPLYFLFALKRVYQQGWAMTLTKYFLIGFSYLILLSLATAFVALLSFVLL